MVCLWYMDVLVEADNDNNNNEKHSKVHCHCIFCIVSNIL